MRSNHGLTLFQNGEVTTYKNRLCALRGSNAWAPVACRGFTYKLQQSAMSPAYVVPRRLSLAPLRTYSLKTPALYFQYVSSTCPLTIHNAVGVATVNLEHTPRMRKNLHVKLHQNQRDISAPFLLPARGRVLTFTSCDSQANLPKMSI